MTETRKFPPLGGGSTDFNAVHDADAKGKDLAEAIEKATTRPTPRAAPPAADEASKPAKRATPPDADS